MGAIKTKDYFATVSIPLTSLLTLNWLEGAQESRPLFPAAKVSETHMQKIPVDGRRTDGDTNFLNIFLCFSNGCTISDRRNGHLQNLREHEQW
jgi:hypothetical protein